MLSSLNYITQPQLMWHILIKWQFEKIIQERHLEFINNVILNNTLNYPIP